MACNLQSYRTKTDDELQYIIDDAKEAAAAMRSIGNYEQECKYLDQINDACTVQYTRRQVELKAA